ncbi:HAMP domain-containing histidine kinase [Hymenobacter taeanensis]|uniref:histidine kinase n=1 Tax=Hymenobacter taeanensis TaxID=2735321 RepID=A0A6M6BFI3_9BACT|nr:MULTISPECIES: HAMP domain-containing sensor histidine kinase [Hymenobacter]QJX46977.1 HAMP domain-containing histidine kinase [Hymenobacter taeanensis]UOQ80853.1 HAMP domain-containing histidine kinase [Hymenobacter sp. 5414T-23]
MLDFATLFRPLAERGQQLYFVYHLEGKRIEYASASAQTVLGVAPENLLEALPAILARLHPDDRSYAQTRLGHLLQGRFVEDVELRLLDPENPDGPIQWVCVTAARVEQGPGRTYLSGTVQDVTRNREYIENADRFNTKKNTTLEILSHDLAGPFIMIKQVAGFVSEKVEDLNDSTVNELLSVMQTTCQDSINMIRDFVDTEFLESVNVQMKPERTNLAHDLQQLIGQFQSSQEDLNKHFIYEGPEQLYYSLDKNKFMQVINNLLSNSIKFTPDGGRISVVLQPSAEEVLIKVIDTGIGIPAAVQPVLFERFTPARRPGLRGEKTNGLGMSIIKAIVELHGGRIWVESTEQQGSTFFISLPRKEAD